MTVREVVAELEMEHATGAGGDGDFGQSVPFACHCHGASGRDWLRLCL